jgi:hypothetical protein
MITKKNRKKNLNRMLLPYIKNLNLRYLKRNLNLSIEHSIKLTIKRNTNGIAPIKHFKRLAIADEIGFCRFFNSGYP